MSDARWGDPREYDARDRDDGRPRVYDERDREDHDPRDRDLLDSHTLERDGEAPQAFHAGVSRPREIDHDSNLYATYRQEEARLRAGGPPYGVERFSVAPVLECSGAGAWVRRDQSHPRTALSRVSVSFYRGFETGCSVVEQPCVLDDERAPQQFIRCEGRCVAPVVIDEEEPCPASIQQRQSDVR